MKKLSIYVIALIGMLSLGSMNSYAQKIGVVDGQIVLDNFSEYTSANKKLADIIKTWQDTLSMKNKALSDKYEQYQKILESMSKEAKMKADEELKAMQTDIQNYNNQKSNQTDGDIVKVRKDLMAPIVEKVKTAITATAKKMKLDIVLDKGNVAYVNDEDVKDITKAVSDALKK